MRLLSHFLWERGKRKGNYPTPADVVPLCKAMSAGAGTAESLLSKYVRRVHGAVRGEGKAFLDDCHVVPAAQQV